MLVLSEGPECVPTQSLERGWTQHSRCLAPKRWIEVNSKRFGEDKLSCVRFDFFTAVALKCVVFWDIETQFGPRKETYYVSATEPSQLMLSRLEVFTSVTIWREPYSYNEVSERWRTVSSGMLRRVAPVRTDVSEELSASFIRVTRISELGTTLEISSQRASVAGYS
jgi:hypothetical protein